MKTQLYTIRSLPDNNLSDNQTVILDIGASSRYWRTSRLLNITLIRRAEICGSGFCETSYSAGEEADEYELLQLLAEELRYEPFLIGAQNVSFPLGCGGYKTSDLNCSCAPTGELCPDDLTALGCRAVLLGSMDRRIVLGETPEVIACKAAFTFPHAYGS